MSGLLHKYDEKKHEYHRCVKALGSASTSEGVDIMVRSCKAYHLRTGLRAVEDKRPIVSAIRSDYTPTYETLSALLHHFLA